ncbi:cytochrome P450 [Aspergillus candidus]|uniref:Cytochrome P450 monooxygenase otaC n=1 Tax=Aspergillus candidus TaxID=41067 RepID=A0A2I2F854_ASPCN|nr:putative cytochrome P450 [Aspergillus candidus]PLB36812.1 putative cytochrome P450 [Aspergillus candidus]
MSADGILATVCNHPWATCGIVFGLYLSALAIYRLLLHPLSSYPGPRIAALTVWYEFYYDCILRGKYTFEIQRMHEKYGPIVRISPHELHVNDPSFIDELYAGGGKKRDKYPFFTVQTCIPDSVFGTPGHDLHRLRRGAMNRFFSKASVTKLEPMIRKAVEKLCAQLEGHAGSGNPIKMNDAFSCMTTDVVTEYAFAKSYNFLDSPTFQPNFHRAIIAGSDMGPWIKQFPVLMPLMNILPNWLVMKVNPEAAIFLQFQEDIRRQIREVQVNIAEGKTQSASTKTIFHELLTGDLPTQEKRIERLGQEGQIVVGAGTETTAWTLSAIAFYLLDNPTVMARLQVELKHAIPDKDNASDQITWNQLEQLPYLSAVITEGLRLSYGVSTRLQRINPLGPLHFRARSGKDDATGKERWVEYAIPQGTPVGMTATLIHTNPELFPDPYVFRPERWLDEQGKRHHDLDGYILSFSRGSRQCIGINLAYAELYMCIGLLVRRLGSRMELFETTLEDVEIHFDRFVPTPKDGTQGIRVLVRAEE